MATFKYISKDMSAKTIRGTLEADDRNDLVRKLKEQNLFLVSCQDVTKKTVNQYKMKLNELSAYSREIGTMLASGLSLIRIFSIMVRREDNKKIKKIYENIYGELILIGFLIPIFLANTLKKEKEMERTIMILAFLSKQKWCKMMIRKMSEWSFFFTISIQWPLIFSNVFCNMISSKRIEKWEIIYAFLTWILSFIMFLTISLITILIKMKLNSEVGAFLGVIILLFSPEFCQKILQIPVIGSFSQLFLSSYLFYGNYWIWQKQVMVILILIGILLFAIQAVMDMTEKRDYFL